MIDVHAHLNFQDFAKDYQEVAKESFSSGVKAIINIGSNFKTSQKAVLIAQEIPFCFASVGIHPIHYNEEEFSKKKFIDIINNSNEKVVAIGETGFDYHHLPKEAPLAIVKKSQEELLVSHLELAKKFNLPLIFHCRGSENDPFGAYLDLLAVLEKWRGKIQGEAPHRLVQGKVPYRMVRGEVHCFCGNAFLAEKFLNLGFYLGFTGNITFKNIDESLLEAVSFCPKERILAETDCPYLAPEPFRGKRNLPHYVIYTIKKIARLRKESMEETEVLLEENSRRLFGI
ncbi:TatD family hydrolase [Candidatus Shapirobacteria bacterium]|nr:TatD family hydrolase [Candidatus Shapirobacteria bacterium]